MPEIKVDRKTAFYTTGGKPWEEGLPLALFVHAAGCTQSVWILQSRALAHHGWNVAAVDLPGHGFSEDVQGIASIEDYAAWLHGFIAALGVERAVLAGHSMGAGISLTLAATHPAQAAALILLGTRAEMEVHPGLLRDTAENPVRAAQFITAYGYSKPSHMGGAPTPGHWLLGAAQALIEGCPAPVLHRDFKASNEWDGMAYAGKVSCPTLVITGQTDRMTPAAKGHDLAKAIPGAAYVEVPAAGHFVMAEAPREVLKEMQGFMDGLPKDGEEGGSGGKSS